MSSDTSVGPIYMVLFQEWNKRWNFHQASLGLFERMYKRNTKGIPTAI